MAHAQWQCSSAPIGSNPVGSQYPNGSYWFSNPTQAFTNGVNSYFVPGPPYPSSAFFDLCDALGAPDYSVSPGSLPPAAHALATGAVSLGHGGRIAISFQPPITNSGDSSPDLVIFEADAVAERVFVELQIADSSTSQALSALIENPDGDIYISPLGGLAPAAAHVVPIDLDAIWPGFPANTLSFNGVEITDDSSDHPNDSVASPGADIDAVGRGPILQFGCPSWRTFSGSGVDGSVHAVEWFDDGTGLALYAGGSFQNAGGSAAKGLARWNGIEWSPVDATFDGVVSAFAVFDDGSGPALYVATTSTMGSTSGQLFRCGAGGVQFVASTNAAIHSLAVHDDGNGAALYIGGSFTFIYSATGSASVARIARLHQGVLTSVGLGMDAEVRALTSFDDGTGAALYAGGAFVAAGTVAAPHVARWRNGAWESVGSGVNGNVLALEVHDDGGGTALFAGGTFTQAGGSSASKFARWRGGAWSSLGSTIAGSVYALRSFDDPITGPGLAVGGWYSSGSVANFAVWRNGALAGATAVNPDGPVRAIATEPIVGGHALTMAGDFGQVAPGVPLRRIARVSANSVTPFGGLGLDGEVRALCVHDDGSGPALYAGGVFTLAGAVAASNVARFDGVTWSPLGSGVNGAVETMSSFDFGFGPRLFVGGTFTSAGGQATTNLAAWDGAQWSTYSGIDGAVRASTVFDDGTGPALILGGEFAHAGGVSAARIARCNGVTFTAMGAGFDHQTGYTPSVDALAVGYATYSLSTTPHQGVLFAGGAFTNSGQTSTPFLARFVGNAWLGELAVNWRVRAICDHPLYGYVAGGEFTNPPWQNYLTPIAASYPVGFVRALAMYDDGAGDALFVGGEFTTWQPPQPPWSLKIPHVARLASMGQSAPPTPLGSGLNGDARAFAVFDDGTGPALYVGGSFTRANDRSSVGIAAWKGCPPGIATFGQGCPGLGGIVPELDLYGGTHANGQGRLSVRRGVGNSLALLFMGVAPANVPLGYGCTLLTAPLLPAIVEIPLFSPFGGPGQGAADLYYALPASVPPVELTLQAFVLDASTPLGASATNAVTMRLK
ncbi:MAG: hypothetical protein JNL94_02670 [Planctomycetes bacterium]|nr:hypothetical protein [Planctomycetota bacterium]